MGFTPANTVLPAGSLSDNPSETSRFGLGPGGPSSVASKRTTLTAAYVSSDQQTYTPFMQDSFVARASSVALTVGLTGSSKGDAKAVFVLYVGGPNQANPLYAVDGTAAAPASVYRLGYVWYDQAGTIQRTVQLSGLIQGATYNWVVMCAIEGGGQLNNAANNSTLAGTFNNVTALALRSGVANKLDKGWYLNQGAVTTSQLVPFTLGGRGFGWLGLPTNNPSLNTGSVLGTFQSYGSTVPPGANPGPSLALTTPGAVAVTPDGTKVVAAGKGNPDPVLYVVDADANTVNLSGPTNNTATITNTTAGGASVTFTAANSYAIGDSIFVTAITPATLNGVGVVTAASGTQFTLTMNVATSGAYVSGGVGYRMYNASGAIVCDNTYAYIGDYFAKRIVRVNLATGAYAGFVALTGQPLTVALSPDASKLAVGQQNGQAVVITLASFTLTTTFNMTTLSPVGTAGQIGAATVVFGAAWTDNNAFWMQCQTATVGTTVRCRVDNGGMAAFAMTDASPTSAVAGYTPSRTDSLNVSYSSASSFISDPNISYADQWRQVTGANIPANSYVTAPTPGVGFILSSSVSSSIPANPTGAGTAVTVQGALVFFVTFTGNITGMIWASGPYAGQSVLRNGLTGAVALACTNDGQIYVALGTQNAFWEWPGGTFAMQPDAINNDYAEVSVLGGS